MKSFSIRELETFSGVKAHAIRIWEKRYAVLKPHRSNGNFRHYTLEEVMLMLDIALLTKNGFTISQVAGMEADVLRHEVYSLICREAKQTRAVNELIICMFSGNIEAFETILDGCVLCWGIDTTIQQVIIPFLEKVNLLSYSDSSSETHFAV
ncbi:MAG: MerR family transcriptional regulator [Bacteroidota bacterium]|nr:MerR family transcriptional regulator [Flavisolibacter sp.]MDQ3845577.1 MerR family transcriptional regulator [Bacteroidota bacterium]MBD0284074.1 MerR family transcriptional regulator [Flavisolibacter sp.]MBD0296165.1 MerR family transcriptional regulator [Flavisolibacter sp.]MBD0349642.1 MerR family transcriptional regulator [Flavisolibacter sp.]